MRTTKQSHLHRRHDRGECCDHPDRVDSWCRHWRFLRL